MSSFFAIGLSILAAVFVPLGWLLYRRMRRFEETLDSRVEELRANLAQMAHEKPVESRDPVETHAGQIARLNSRWMPDAAAFLENAGKLPRYTLGRPNPHIGSALEASRAKYCEILDGFLAERDRLEKIPLEGSEDQAEPYWLNGGFTGLDAVALYCLIARYRPRRFVEIGSGHSTRFARRSIIDHSLHTKIIVIDPKPATPVVQIADTIVRERMETVDLAAFNELEEGDILFIDSSHQLAMNSDVTAYWLDILPALKPGVVVHIHDIFWPLDYPAQWSRRLYNEQYVLGALLAHRAPTIQVMLANGFIAVTPEYKPLLEKLYYASARLRTAIERQGAQSIWIEKLK